MAPQTGSRLGIGPRSPGGIWGFLVAGLLFSRKHLWKHLWAMDVRRIGVGRGSRHAGDRTAQPREYVGIFGGGPAVSGQT